MSLPVNYRFNPFWCFFGSEGHVALDRNPGPGYDTLLLRMIQGDLLSAFPHRQFHTLPGLLDSWAALPNSNPNALRAMQGGSLYHFYDGLWYDPAEANSRPTVREAGTPPTKPNRHGQSIISEQFFLYKVTKEGTVLRIAKTQCRKWVNYAQTILELVVPLRVNLDMHS